MRKCFKKEALENKRCVLLYPKGMRGQAKANLIAGSKKSLPCLVPGSSKLQTTTEQERKVRKTEGGREGGRQAGRQAGRRAGRHPRCWLLCQERKQRNSHPCAS